MAFRGGYRFTRFEGIADPVVREAALPQTAIVSRTQAGVVFAPVAKEGDVVHAGTPLLDAGDIGLPSPVSGLVTSITDEAISIAGDGNDLVEPLPGHTREPWHLDHDEALNLFRVSGCVLLTSLDLSSFEACANIRHLIISAVHNGPLDHRWLSEMYGDPSLFADGLRALVHLFPQAITTIAATKRTAHAIAGLPTETMPAVAVLSDKYPQEYPDLLTRDVAGARLFLPEGERDNRVLVLRFEDVLQIGEAMTRGRPLVDQIVLVAGPGVSSPGWYRIRIGTPFAHIAERLFKSGANGNWRVVRGTPLDGVGMESLDTGLTIDDHAVTVLRTETSRRLFGFLSPGLALDSYTHTTAATIPILPKRVETDPHGGERPCVQCNACDEVCPVAIYPFLIWKYVATDDPEGAFRLRPADCIGCGLCDYVCPSKIALSAGVAAATAAFRESKRASKSEATDAD